MTVRLLHPTELPAMVDWIEQALCAQMDAEMWFPDKGRADAGRAAEAIAVCKRCPVVELCLERALALERSSGELAGVWGATTPTARRALRRGLPALCRTCPGERKPTGTHCIDCQKRRARERQQRYQDNRVWGASA